MIEQQIPDLLPGHVVLLTGPPKSGKSRLVQRQALSVARKSPDRPVMVLSLNEDERLIQERLREWAGEEPWPPNLYFSHDWPTMEDDPDTIERLEEWMSANPETRLIVIDPLIHIRPHGKTDRESLKPLRAFANRHRNLSVIVVTHDHPSSPTGKER